MFDIPKNHEISTPVYYGSLQPWKKIVFSPTELVDYRAQDDLQVCLFGFDVRPNFDKDGDRLILFYYPL